MSRLQNQATIALGLFRQFQLHIRSNPNLPHLIQKHLATTPQYGSRDRRLYRELLYTAIRYLPWIEEKLSQSDAAGTSTLAYLCAEIPATAPFKTTFTAPELLSAPPAHTLTLAQKATLLGTSTPILPDWFQQQCPNLPSADLERLHSRAPLWIRLQTHRPQPLFDEFASRNWQLRQNPLLPDAYQVTTDASLTGSTSYKNGLFEIQDLGSQLILAQQPELPSGNWLDLCAGAGGKTLQLARLLRDTGHVDAHDNRPHALDELQQRAARAHIDNITIQKKLPENKLYDAVLVDAPCTGLGTLRRAPHLKWQNTPATIAAVSQQQQQLLSLAAQHLKPSAPLIYATCSITEQENTGTITAFLKARPDFRLVHERHILPTQHDTDAFYTATLRIR